MSTTKHNKDIVQHAIDKLENLNEGIDASEVHNVLFNQDYFIIGRFKAEQWLIKNPGIFTAIGDIKEYEVTNFGEVTTDISEPEKVVNMYVYIKGEILLAACLIIERKQNKPMSKKDIDTLRSQLTKLLKEK